MGRSNVWTYHSVQILSFSFGMFSIWRSFHHYLYIKMTKINTISFNGQILHDYKMSYFANSYLSQDMYSSRNTDNFQFQIPIHIEIWNPLYFPNIVVFRFKLCILFFNFTSRNKWQKKALLKSIKYRKIWNYMFYFFIPSTSVPTKTWRILTLDMMS